MSDAPWLLVISLQFFLWAELLELRGRKPVECHLAGWVFLALALLETFTPPVKSFTAS